MKISLSVVNFLGILLVASYLASATESSQYVRIGRQLQDEVDDSIYQNIVGGEETEEHEFPAYVLFANGECGGTLIAPDRVLTSANCVYGGHPDTVRVGASTRTNGHEVKVKCAKSHPNYLWPHYPHDIAVLKLKEEVTYLAPAELNRNTSYPSEAGTNLTVAGMGRNETKGVMFDRLMKLKYEYVTDLECKKTYGDAVSQGLHICAYKIRVGVCFGDGGSGLYDDEGLLVGALTGAAGGCAATKVYDVYADVAAFYDWIQSQMTDETCDRECVGCLCDAYLWTSNRASRLFRSIGNLFS